MTAPDLFAYAESRHNYRVSDPITSRDAGRAAHKFTAEHHQIILSVLRHAGRPLAAEQISDAIGFGFNRGKYSLLLDYVAVGKRTNELIEAGLIERTAERHTNRSGRSAFKLRIRQSQSLPAAIPSGSQP
jgi:hypothetical protein